MYTLTIMAFKVSNLLLFVSYNGEIWFINPIIVLYYILCYVTVT